MTRNTGSQGISHAMVAERYALPGQLIVGTDSHTPHSGALGCVAFGVGTTDIANAFVTGAVRITMPESLRVDVAGPLPAGVTAKDVVLHLLALPAVRAGAGVGKVFEFGGSAVRAMSIDERATLTNMMAELGGFTGIVAPDDETRRFLRERRGVDFTIEPWMAQRPRRAATPTRSCSTAGSCRRWSPRPATPATGGRCARSPSGRASTSPTAARAPRASARTSTTTTRCCAGPPIAGCAWPTDVKLYLQFGTVDVRDHCIAQGYLAAFEAVGAELLQPACGACANCGPGASTVAAAGDGERDQPQFPRPLGAGLGVAGQPAHRGRERDRRRAGVVRRVAAPFRRSSHRGGVIAGRRRGVARDRLRGCARLCLHKVVPVRAAREAPPLALAR